MPSSQLPLLPLILDRIPAGLAGALAQEGVPHRAWSLGAPQGRFLLFDGRQGPSRPVGPGQIPINLDHFRPARGEDPFLALEDEQTAAYSRQFGNLQVVYDRGRSDRRAVRQKLLEPLRMRIETEGGIWLCLAPYPFPYRSAFNVRLDHPAYEPEAFDAALQASTGHESAVSHFLQIAGFYPFPEALARLRGFDLGVLGNCPDFGDCPNFSAGKMGLSPSPQGPSPFRLPDTSRRQLEHFEHQLRHEFDLMRRVGLEPEGFLPPDGRYLPALLPLLRRIDFPYVVLNDLGADDLPFFPASSPLLHLPAHPVGIQNLLAVMEDSGFRVQGSDEREHSAFPTPHSAFPSSHSSLATRHSSPSSYFTETIQQKYQAGEPLFFHGRIPGGWERHPELLTRLFDLGQECSAAWKTTLSRFARWWKARGEVRLTVVEQDGLYLLSTDYLPRDFRLGIEYHRGRHVARMALAQRVLRFSPSALAYENRPSASSSTPVRLVDPDGDSLSSPCNLHVHDPHEGNEPTNVFLRVLRVLRGRKKSAA